jgi:hypothetical protein
VPEGAGEAPRLRLEVALSWRDIAAAWSDRRASKEDPSCCEAADDVRRCLLVLGMEKPEPERRGSLGGSWLEGVAEAEDVFDTTEAFCAARSKESSRVSRFTCRRQYRPMNLLIWGHLPLPLALSPTQYVTRTPSTDEDVVKGPDQLPSRHPVYAPRVCKAVRSKLEGIRPLGWTRLSG